MMVGVTDIQLTDQCCCSCHPTLLFMLPFSTIADNSLKLDDQLWHEVKPGLSSYADNPKEVSTFFLKLVFLLYLYPILLKSTMSSIL